MIPGDGGTYSSHAIFLARRARRCVTGGRGGSSFPCLGWRGLGVAEGDHPFLRGAVGALQALRDQHVVTVGGVAVDVFGHLQVTLPAAVPYGGADEGQQFVLSAGADCPAGP
jgi:hypothetical protein